MEKGKDLIEMNRNHLNYIKVFIKNYIKFNLTTGGRLVYLYKQFSS